MISSYYKTGAVDYGLSGNFCYFILLKSDKRAGRELSPPALLDFFVLKNVLTVY